MLLVLNAHRCRIHRSIAPRIGTDNCRIHSMPPLRDVPLAKTSGAYWLAIGDAGHREGPGELLDVLAQAVERGFVLAVFDGC